MAIFVPRAHRHFAPPRYRRPALPPETAPGYVVSARSVAYFAALLTLDPPAAPALVVVAQLLGGMGLFLCRDAAQFVLAFGLGGLLTAAALPPRPPATLDAHLALRAIPAAAIVHFRNTGAVAAMAALQRRRSPCALAGWAARGAA